jgi:hypothetical protein
MVWSCVSCGSHRHFGEYCIDCKTINDHKEFYKNGNLKRCPKCDKTKPVNLLYKNNKIYCLNIDCGWKDETNREATER